MPKATKMVRIIYINGRTREVAITTHSDKHLKRPKVIDDYNKYYHTIDHFDQEVKTIQWQHKCRKWTTKVLLFLIEMCLYNAWIIFKMSYDS